MEHVKREIGAYTSICVHIAMLSPITLSIQLDELLLYNKSAPL
jgi:hypothetical protein